MILDKVFHGVLDQGHVCLLSQRQMYVAHIALTSVYADHSFPYC